MTQIQDLHQTAMDLAETADLAKLRGEIEQSQQLLQQAFEMETRAAQILIDRPDAEPTRSILYRSAASLAIDCGEPTQAERLIATALSGNPPPEIAEELKDLFIQINLAKYFERRGIHWSDEQLDRLANSSTL
jgi:hypothetical protein